MNLLRHTLLLLLVLFLTGCQNIPSNTPLLLQKNNERLEIQATTVAAAFQTTLDEITFTKGDVAEAKQLLSEIDSRKLKAVDQQKLLDAIQLLNAIESNLSVDPNIQSHPSTYKIASKEILEVYNLIRILLMDHVEQQELINDLIKNIQQVGE